MPVHKCMLEISELIYETCKTYLLQQGKFLAGLGDRHRYLHQAYYFAVLRAYPIGSVVIILIMSVAGHIWVASGSPGSVSASTLSPTPAPLSHPANGKPFPVYSIPLQAGMSIGMMLICIELFMMLSIMLFLPADVVGPCFIGFAIGEDLSAPACSVSAAVSSPRLPTSAPT